MTSAQETLITDQTAKPREDWIDYLRGIAILLMIIGHTSVYDPIRMWIYGFHMPLFFMISGLLFNKTKWHAVGYRQFLITRVKNYLIPYFLWCGICFLINLPMLYYTYRDDNFPSALLQNLGWIATSVRVDGVFLPQNCTPLWFLTCLFLSQQVFYWLLKCKPVWQFVLCGVFIAINYIMNLFQMPILLWHFEVSLIGAVFMLLGYSIREKKLLENIKNPWIILAMFIGSSVLIMITGFKDLYYRLYGTDLTLYMISAAIMCYTVIWTCKSFKTLYLKTIICSLGMYSVIAMALNYSINRYVRAAYQTVSNLSGINLDWMEYPLILINIVICLAAIAGYRKLATKHQGIRVFIGR